jgi:hypothetical protein
MPEMVGTIAARLDPSDTEDASVHTLDCTALTFALVNAIKELEARVAMLEERLADR